MLSPGCSLIQIFLSLVVYQLGGGRAPWLRLRLQLNFWIDTRKITYVRKSEKVFSTANPSPIISETKC